MGSSHGWVKDTLGHIVGLLRSTRIARLPRCNEPPPLRLASGTRPNARALCFNAP
jgi:hypothetical protein